MKIPVGTLLVSRPYLMLSPSSGLGNLVSVGMQAVCASRILLHQRNASK